MEDFIYLIVLIAWVIFAYYRRSQKKAAGARKQVVTPEQETDSETTPIPTFQEILFGDDEEVMTRRQPRPATVIDEGNYMPDRTETDFEKEYNRRGIVSVEETDRLANKRPVRVSEIKEIEVKDESDIKEASDEAFDIRRAVIYSEILNRPYV